MLSTISSSLLIARLEGNRDRRARCRRALADGVEVEERQQERITSFEFLHDRDDLARDRVARPQPWEHCPPRPTQSGISQTTN